MANSRADNKWTFTANGNGEGFRCDTNKARQLTAWGTWGGGTLTIEFSPDGGTTWISVVDAATEVAISLTANGAKGKFYPSMGYHLRPVLAGATTPSLSVHISEVDE